MMKLQKSDLYEYLSQNIFPLSKEGKQNKKVGLEIEMFPFEALEGENGKIFHRTSLDKTKAALFSYLKDKSWLQNPEASYIYKKNKAQISFEPGGQLEYSSSPRESFSDLSAEINKVQREIKKELSKNSILLLQTGLDPWHGIDRLKVQLKEKRYELMSEYFGSLQGSLGRNMQLQTSSVQVCLDFCSNEERQVKQYITSQFLAPYGSAIFANSPYLGGKRSLYESFRSYIWLKTDKTRTGFPFKEKTDFLSLSREGCIRSYLDFALDAHLIFYREGGLIKKSPENFTFRKWMDFSKESGPTLEDFKKSLSLLFPEVRPKGFLEIRSVDGQGYKWQMVPAVFYAGLLYDDEALDEAFNMLCTDLKTLKEEKARSCYGLSSPELKEKAKDLMKLSLKGFERLLPEIQGDSELERACEFYNLYTKQGKSPSFDFELYLKNLAR